MLRPARGRAKAPARTGWTSAALGKPTLVKEVKALLLPAPWAYLAMGLDQAD